MSSGWPMRSTSRSCASARPLAELPRLDVQHARAGEAVRVQLVSHLDQASLRLVLPERVLVLVDECDVLRGQLREMLLVVRGVDRLQRRDLEVELLELLVHGQIGRASW